MELCHRCEELKELVATASFKLLREFLQGLVDDLLGLINDPNTSRSQVEYSMRGVEESFLSDP